MKPKLDSINTCDSATAQTHGWIFMKFSTNARTDDCEVCFSQILTFLNDDVMAAIFFIFSLGHSHGRNFAPIFFKIDGEVKSCLPLIDL